MTRRPTNPTLRFADIIPIWDAVLRDDGGTIKTRDRNEMIALVYRLNQYRKIMRDREEDGWTDLDRYIIRRGNNQVFIEPRPIFDISRMEKLDGTPASGEPPTYVPSPLDEVIERMADGLMAEDVWHDTNKILQARGEPPLPRSRIRPKAGSFIE